MLSGEDNELLTRVGPRTPMGALFRRYWLPALLSEEVPEPGSPPARVRLLGEDLVAFRDAAGEVGLIDAYCGHRGANLYWGRNEGEGLRCVYHGWMYDREGNCVDMPNEPQESTFKDKVRIRAYPAVDKGGVIWAYLGPQALKPQLPELEWTLVPDSHRYVHKRIQRCNYLQNVEGEVDSAHISFLHKRFDETSLQSVQGQSLFLEQTDAAPRFSLQETDYGLLVGARRELSGGHDYYWRVTQFLMPSYTMIPTEPGEPVSFTAAVPMDDQNMLGFTVTWHPHRPLTEEEIATIESWEGIYTELVPGAYRTALNKENEYGLDRMKQRSASFSGIRGIREQDLAVQEDQRGPVLDRRREHLGTTDLAIIALRRRLLVAVKALQQGKEPPEACNGAVYRVRSAAFRAPGNAVWHRYAKVQAWMNPRD